MHAAKQKNTTVCTYKETLTLWNLYHSNEINISYDENKKLGIII